MEWNLYLNESDGKKNFDPLLPLSGMGYSKAGSAAPSRSSSRLQKQQSLAAASAAATAEAAKLVQAAAAAHALAQHAIAPADAEISPTVVHDSR